MNPPSATVFLSSAELVICLTPSFSPPKQSLQNPFATFQLCSQNPPHRHALWNPMSLYKLILWHSANTMPPLSTTHLRNSVSVILTKSGINQCFSTQQGPQLFSKSRKTNTLRIVLLIFWLVAFPHQPDPFVLHRRWTSALTPTPTGCPVLIPAALGLLSMVQQSTLR